MPYQITGILAICDQCFDEHLEHQVPAKCDWDNIANLLLPGFVRECDYCGARATLALWEDPAYYEYRCGDRDTLPDWPQQD